MENSEGNFQGIKRMRKKSFQILATLAGFFFILVVIFLIFFWNRGYKGPSFEREIPEVPVIDITGVEFTQLDDEGQKLWILFASEAVEFEKRTVLKNTRVRLFKDGQPVSEGRADSIVVENSTSNLYLKGDIHIVSYRDGAELRTSELQWNNMEKKLRTESEVIIKRKGFVIEGEGLICNPDLSLIIIKNKVRTYFEGGIE